MTSVGIQEVFRSMERVADYIIGRLVECGIKHIFLITGRGILYLTDAVAKNEKIVGVSTYHEQGAAYAAMAYAAASEGMAACLVSTGCAAMNAVTAALCAYQDNLPVIFISGQHMLNETTRYTGTPIRTFGSQEADIVSVVEPVTKHATMLTDPSKVGYEMDKAINLANEGRKGPVWIDVPLDIQNARIEGDNLERYISEVGIVECSETVIQEVADELRLAKRPVIFAGGGIRSASAVDILREFVETKKLPLVYSTTAADVYSTSNAYSVGAVGSIGGSRAGNFAVQNADYILAIGTKLCSQSVGISEQFAREARIVVVDIDENEHTKKGVKLDRIIISDAKKFLTKLNVICEKMDCAQWIEKCEHWKDIFALKNEPFVKKLMDENEIDLYQFADVLSDLLPDDATVITDAGMEELIIPSSIRYKQNQRCLFPASQGAMGYAIPAVLGAFYAGKKNIVAIVGDGSFMMNMQELQLIGSYQIPVKMFVINNNMYAVIRKRQHDLFRNRTIGNDPSDGLPAPDFKRIANCFGIAYTKIDVERCLVNGVQSVINEDDPCICEVMCVEDQKYLHTSFAINEKRKMVRRPIEDLSPFVDRMIMEHEMIIAPIEK